MVESRGVGSSAGSGIYVHEVQAVISLLQQTGEEIHQNITPLYIEAASSQSPKPVL